MRRLTRHRPSPAMVVALIALVAALGGTAFAAATINGKNIKNGTIVGKKLKKNTVTGTQVKESSLKQVPSAKKAATATSATNATNAANAANADKLGGAAAGAFVKGGGNTVSRSFSPAVDTTNQTILTVPGIGRVLVDCAANGIDTTVKFANDSGVGLSLVGHSVDASNNSVLSPNVPNLNNGATTSIQSRTVGQSTVQVWDEQSGKNATIVVSNIFCLYTASATTNQ